MRSLENLHLKNTVVETGKIFNNHVKILEIRTTLAESQIQLIRNLSTYPNSENTFNCRQDSAYVTGVYIWYMVGACPGRKEG